MDIIPHPAALKKREEELMEMESEISLRACRIYSMEMELEKLIENAACKKRITALKSFAIFSLGLISGYFVFLLSA